MNYWNQKGKNYKKYVKLWNELVPVEGTCKTVEGELLRAMTKIYWDYYNNGFGNNWSGAFNFLKKYQEAIGLKQENLDKIFMFRRGKVIRGENFEKPLESLMDQVVAYVYSKKGVYTPNTEDLYNFSEPETAEPEFFDEAPDLCELEEEFEY